MKKNIYPFKSKIIPGLKEVGGKAQSLIVITKEKFSVPNGFVLAVDFFESWFEEVEKSVAWKNFLKSTESQFKKNCDALKKSCGSLKQNSSQKKSLDVALKKLSKNNLFAVRSSSPEEDLEGISFAGIYETTLGVTKETLEKAILHSFKSVFDERIVKYKIQHKMRTDKPRIAVIVQEQIASEVSGVAFSLNPQNNCYDEVVINSSFGLGETIVAGQVTPDTFVVDLPKRKILEKKIANKDRALWLAPTGGTKEEAVKKPSRPSLTDKQVKDVAKLAGDVEKLFGKPVDIEWAYFKKKLYLLQARPITAYLSLFPEMVTKPGEKKNLYLDIIILTQGFSEPLSVLGMDIWAGMLEVAKRASMPRGRDGVAFDVHGRQYMHVSNMMKGGGSFMKKMMSTYDAPTRKVFESIDNKEYTPEKTPEKMRGYIWGVIKMMVSMLPGMWKGMFHGDQALTAYQKLADNIWKYLENELPKSDKHFDTLVKNGLNSFGDLVEVAGLLISPMYARWRLDRMFKGRKEAKDLIVALNMDLPGNPTSEMGHLMLKIASFPEFQKTRTSEEFIKKIKIKKYSKKFLKTYKEYIYKFGCRGMQEIDVAVPRTYEDPAKIFLQIKQINIKNNAIKTVKKRSEEAYDKLLKMAREMGKEKKFVEYAKIQHDMAGYREHPKYIYVVVVDVLRKHALRLGAEFVKQGRLKEVNQIFSLNIAQVVKAEKNPKLKLLPIIEKNMAPYKAVEHIKDWPRIIDSRGKIFRAKRISNDGLVGDAISPGVVRGKAKVLHSPYEKSLNKGEILVAKMSEPSWTPIFINAAGVVLEVGGPLQHGAIIAREYGLPCVSGVDGVTKSIKDGDMLEVDGSNGIVRIIPEDAYDLPVVKNEWIVPYKDFLYARASIVELLPDPLSPLFETMAGPAISKTMIDLVKELMPKAIKVLNPKNVKFVTLNGYGYYAMKFSNWGMFVLMIRIMPRFGKILGGTLKTWKEVKRPNYLEQIEYWKKRSSKKLSAKELFEAVEELTVATMAHYTAVQAILPVSYMSEGMMTKYYNKLIKRKKDSPAQNFVMGYDSVPILADKSLYDIAMWSKSKERKNLKNYLLKTPAEKVSELLSRRTVPGGVSSREWKEWQKKFKIHLEKFGHVIYDLDFMKAVSADHPDPLFDTMKFYMQGKGRSPYERQKEMAGQRERDVGKILKRIGPIRRWGFKKLLKWTQKYAPVREDGLADVALAWPLVRQMFFELGRRLKLAKVLQDEEDVFWLKKKELAVCTGKLDRGSKIESFQKKIKERKGFWIQQRKLTPLVMVPEDYRFFGLKISAFLPKTKQEGENIEGIGASQGKVTGVARVILSPDEFHLMKPGEILVTAITTPAWTPLFAIASGIVTDVGGPLSHSSIVAREYGVPAVLGTGMASKMIKSGQKITVDGDAGIVYLQKL